MKSMFKLFRKKRRSFIGNCLDYFFKPSRRNNHRSKILHPDSLFIVVSACIVFALAIHQIFPNFTKMVLGYASNISADEVIAITNEERQKEGLPLLKASRKLNQAALAKAQHMFSGQYWAHTSPDDIEPWYFFKEVDYEYVVAGENLAKDFSHTNDMVGAWMASPTHKANITNDRYTDIGIAVLNGELDGVETTLVVQLFGKPTQGSADIGDSVSVVNSDAKKVAGEVTVQSNQEIVNEDGSIMTSANLPAYDLMSSPIFNPLKIIQAFFLFIIVLIVFTLVYDSIIVKNLASVRFVGKNMGHIMLLVSVFYLLVVFRSGVIK